MPFNIPVLKVFERFVCERTVEAGGDGLVVVGASGRHGSTANTIVSHIGFRICTTVYTGEVAARFEPLRSTCRNRLDLTELVRFDILGGWQGCDSEFV